MPIPTGMENKVEIEAFTQSHLREVKTKIKKQKENNLEQHSES